MIELASDTYNWLLKSMDWLSKHTACFQDVCSVGGKKGKQHSSSSPQDFTQKVITPCTARLHKYRHIEREVLSLDVYKKCVKNS